MKAIAPKFFVLVAGIAGLATALPAAATPVGPIHDGLHGVAGVIVPAQYWRHDGDRWERRDRWEREQDWRWRERHGWRDHGWHRHHGHEWREQGWDHRGWHDRHGWR